MIVQMKKFEKCCSDYCKKFIKNWEFYTIASDSYMNGYRDARIEAEKIALKNNVSFTAKCIREMGEDLVEVEFKDGSHQIGERCAGRKDD